MECLACSNYMVIGEGQRFLSALISFKVDPDPATGLMSRNLSAFNLDFFKKELGIDIKTSDEAVAHPKGRAYVDDCLKKANAKAISRAATVRKYEFLTEDFSQVAGDLTPTLKLKRTEVEKKYKVLIDKMF